MKSRQILGTLLVLMMVGPGWSVMFASAQSTTISVFSTGTAQETITMNGGTHTSIGFDLERNTTIEQSLFFLSPDSGTTQSPGKVWLDLDQNGENEWEFNQTGYGDFGLQTMFADGNNSSALAIEPNGPIQASTNTSDFLLPYGSAITDARMTVGFEPTLTGGFFPLGPITDTAIGDIENNSLADAILLSSSNASTGVGTAFTVMSYTNTTGVSNTSWVPTCTNATRVMVADLNGDSFEDVVTYAPVDSLLCIHIYNGTTGNFPTRANFTLPSSVIDLDIGDVADDGYADLVTIRTGGGVDVAEFSTKSNGFSSVDSAVVYETPQGTTTASLTAMYLARFNGELNPYKLVVVDTTGQCIQLQYSPNGAFAELVTRFDGLGTDSVYGDFDNDGDLDFIATRSTGHRSIENRLTSWDEENHNGLLDLTNATIIDHDYDMDSSLLLPQLTQGDGISSTLDGNFTAYNFRTYGNNKGRVDSSASAILEPWTMPKSIDFGDFDGDGIREHIVVAGEGSQHGVFIGAWHEIGYDVDHNSMADYTASGYAGNGSNGLAPLQILDPVNNLSTQLSAMSFSWPWITDGYGIQMSPVNFSLSTLAGGMFTFTDLNITYDAEFQVNLNPHPSRNLTNVLNQQMTGGSGTLNVPLLFSSTRNGSFEISNPTIAYTEGAPNIALPPTPILQINQLNSTSLELGWQNQTDFGDDLLQFIIYRVGQNQDLDLLDTYSSSISNFTIDMNFSPGEQYDYYVRSVHQYGVTSNLSAPLSITVPYPPPQSYIPNVTAVDRPSDSGGALDITWSPGHSSVNEHQIYVSAVNFTSLNGMSASMTTAASVFNSTLSVDNEGNALLDGTPYFVTVVGVDQFGNFSYDATAFGPVFTRNDSALTTSLDVTYLGFTSDETTSHLLLKKNGALDVTAHLHENGSGVVGADLTLNILGENDNFTLVETTNESGIAVFSISNLTTLGPIEALGQMTLSVSYEGSQGGLIDRPLTPAFNQSSAFGVVDVSFTTVEPILLTENASFSTVLLVNADIAEQQVLLANMVVGWIANDENGSEVSAGIGEVRGNEMELSGIGAYGGFLHIHLDTFTPYYYTEGMAVMIDFEGSPAVEENQTNSSSNASNETTFPDATLAGTIDCGTATYAWEQNSTDERITCTITNPNPFDVLLGFSWKVTPTTPPPVTFEAPFGVGSAPIFTISAEASVQVEFSPIRNGPSDGLFPGIQGVGYVVYFSCSEFGGANQCDSMTTPTASTEGELRWTLSEKLVVDTDNTNDGQSNDEGDGASSSMTPVLVGIGIVIFVAAAIGGAIFMRSRLDDDFDEDDEEDYYAEAMAAPDVSPGPKSLDLNASKSLDSLKAEGKELHEEAPEGIESSMLGSSADAFQFGATAEETRLETGAEDTHEEEHSSEEEWTEEATEEDDGISMDENGTEWWEDEEGVWWYREEGWEDWAVWED